MTKLKGNERAILEKILGRGSDSQAALMAAIAAFAGGGDEKAYNPSVGREGDKIILPEGAKLRDVIDALERQDDFEQQWTQIHVTLPVAPWDGAHALKKAITSGLGLFNQMSSIDGNAHQLDVEVELGKTVQIPWGQFELPGMDGATVRTDTAFEDGRIVFQCHVECKRLYEQRIRRLLEKVREIATKESLHKGKAFSIAFHDAQGRPDRMPKPKFFKITGETPIFRQDLQNSIDRNVLVPIKYAAQRRAQGKSLKRGVLFAGEYGVGKTLLASYIARESTAAGWTFIYVKNPAELPQALQWAVQYQPVVVFVEDIERVAGLDRTKEVNELLNQLDGIDGKASEILTVLTSNHADKINAAMRRPGRIDLVVPVHAPDADTVVRMVEMFAGKLLAPNTDLSGVGAILAGEIPARVKEAVNRAELEANRRTGDVNAKITGADLEAVAREVKAEGEMFRNQVAGGNTNDMSKLADGLVNAGQAMKLSFNGAGKAAHG